MTENLMPAEVSLCTVTFGPPITYAGRGGIVSVKLTATHTIIHQATGTQIRSGEDLLETVSDGTNLSFQVPHVDQAGFIDSTGATVTNWAYTISGEVKFGKVKIPVDRSFQVFVGQDSVDLDLIPTGAVTPGVTAPSAEVLSVAGLTGAPSAQQLVDAIATPLSASMEAAIAGYVERLQPINAQEMVPSNTSIANVSTAGEVGWGLRGGQNDAVLCQRIFDPAWSTYDVFVTIINPTGGNEGLDVVLRWDTRPMDPAGYSLALAYNTGTKQTIALPAGNATKRVLLASSVAVNPDFDTEQRLIRIGSDDADVVTAHSIVIKRIELVRAS